MISGSGYGSYGTSQYGTGQVYKNPSYGGGGGGGGTVSYSNPIYDQTTDQYGRKGGGGGQYDSRHTGGSSSSYMYSSEREHGISNYKNKGEQNATIFTIIVCDTSFESLVLCGFQIYTHVYM